MSVTGTDNTLLLQATVSPSPTYSQFINQYQTTTISGQPEVTNNPNYNNQTIGSTPSAVLFFLALGVGVLIAFLFIFFTIRYFIRIKYGVNLSGLSRRNFYNYQSQSNNNDDNDNGSRNNSVINEHSFAHIFTTTEVQDQLQYIREHHYLRGEIIDRRLNYGSESLSARRRRRRLQRRRRRRRGRFAKMKKLTIEEVELLFPKKSYSSWLNGGKQQDIEKRGGMLYEEEEHQHQEQQQEQSDINNTIHVSDEQNSCETDGDDDNSTLPTLYTSNANTNTNNIGNSSSSNDIEMKKLTIISHDDNEIDLADGITTSPITTSTNEKDQIITDDDIIDQHSLHFDSGSCAICLEIIEDDDIVRGLICGHVFHAECLDPWLTKRRACCPMCKRDYLFKRDYHDPNNNHGIIEENSGNSNNTDGNNNNNRNEENQNNNDNNNVEDDNDNNDDVDDDDDDSLSIDLEELRNDPALQLMLQELIPPGERVRMILNDSRYNELNLEERGHEISNKKYGKFFKIIWWKLMGISKIDLFNWAVLKLVNQFRRDHPDLFQDNIIVNNNNQTTNDEQTEGVTNTENESSNQQEQEESEVDIDELSSSSIRRQIIENRV